MVSHRAFLNTSFALPYSIWLFFEIQAKQYKLETQAKSLQESGTEWGKIHPLPFHEYRSPVVSSHLYFLSLWITKRDKAESDRSLRPTRQTLTSIISQQLTRNYNMLGTLSL